MRWQSWAGTVTASVAGVVDHPPSGRWRPLGAGLSASPLLVTDGHLVRTPVEPPELDTARGEVRLSGGMTVGGAAEWLAERGWWLPTLGTNSGPTIGGATGTCVHGTSRDHGTLSGSVRAIDLRTLDGERVHLGADHPDLPALRVHLGAFGRVERVVLGIVRGARLAVTTEVRTVDEALDPALHATAEQTDGWWLVGTREVALVRRSRTDGPATEHGSRGELRKRLWEEDLPLHLLAGVGTVAGHVAPTLVRRLLRRFWRARPQVRVGRWDHLAVGPRRFRAVSTELAVPADRAAEALDRVTEALHGAPVHVPVNLRWTRSDTDTWLSPGFDRDTLWIDVAWHPRVPGRARWLSAVEAALAPLGARSHWGKLAWADSLSGYRDAARWAEVRGRYDPDGRLLNAHLVRLLASI